VVATRLDGTRRVFAGTQTKLYELSGSSWVIAPCVGATTRFGRVALVVLPVRGHHGCHEPDGCDAVLHLGGVQRDHRGAEGKDRRLGVQQLRHRVQHQRRDLRANADRWWCCAQNDQTIWTPNVSTGATTGRLIAVEGPIQAALMLGDYVVAYKQRGDLPRRLCRRSIVWQWNLVPGGEAGAVGPEACATSAAATSSWATTTSGFSTARARFPVGVGVMRQWFLNNSSPTYRYRTKVSYDRQKSLVSVYYPSLNSDGRVRFPAGVPRRNQALGQGGCVVEAPLNFIAPGVTINALDTVAATINTLPNIPLDAQYWTSGGQVACYFNASQPARLAHRLIAVIELHHGRHWGRRPGDDGRQAAPALDARSRLPRAPGVLQDERGRCADRVRRTRSTTASSTCASRGGGIASAST
jgi:hypothetical protein